MGEEKGEKGVTFASRQEGKTLSGLSGSPLGPTPPEARQAGCFLVWASERVRRCPDPARPHGEDARPRAQGGVRLRRGQPGPLGGAPLLHNGSCPARLFGQAEGGPRKRLPCVSGKLPGPEAVPVSPRDGKRPLGSNELEGATSNSRGTQRRLSFEGVLFPA